MPTSEIKLEVTKLIEAISVAAIFEIEGSLFYNSTAHQLANRLLAGTAELERCLKESSLFAETLSDKQPCVMTFPGINDEAIYLEVASRTIDNIKGWTLQDITERRKTEQRLISRDTRFANIIASAMDGIITVDSNQTILLFNKAAEEIFGYQSQEVIGQSLNLLIPSQFREVHHQHIRNFEQTGVTTRRMKSLSVITGLRANGEEFPMEASISKIKIDNQVLHTVILRDVSERKLLEAQLRQAQQEKLARKQEELAESYQKAERIFSALADILPGTVLDNKYRLDKKIGVGGFGVVYSGTHLSLDRPVAVKIFRPLTANENQENLNRFRLEGISTCRVNHPNAVSILDAGISPEGIVYLVMELLTGRTLSEELEEKRVLSVHRCLEILIPICYVLAEAHRAGIVHRDVKPDNIFIHQTIEGELVKVVDFGIAKFLHHSSGLIDLNNLTVQGLILGTPTYMSPERINNGAYDGRSDIYSLGIMFYQMLSGAPPFSMDIHGLFALAMMHINQPPPPLREINPQVPAEIDELILATLSKDPQARPTAEELAQLCNNLLHTLPPEKLNFIFPIKKRMKLMRVDTFVQDAIDVIQTNEN